MPQLAFIGGVAAAAVVAFGAAWAAFDAVGGSPASPPALSDAAVMAQLQARYDETSAAMARHDLPAVEATMSPDYVSVDLSGQSQTGSQVMDQVQQLKPDPNQTATTTVLSVAPSQGAAIAEQRYDMKTSKTAKGVVYQVELVALSTDTWVKPGKDWLIQRTVTDEMSYFVDGKMVRHNVKS